MAKERVINPKPTFEDKELDNELRPASWKDFAGQGKIKEQLSIFIKAAKDRGEALDHILFHGPPGLGKTTLANIVSRDLGVNINSTSGPVIERPVDLSALLSRLKEKEVLFVDEIHRLPHTVEEVLYSAMEDYKLDIMVGKGPSARAIKLELPHYTLIGATTRTGLITSPLRARFGMIIRIGFYNAGELSRIVKRSARILNIEIDEEGAWELASRSRGTPRVANRLLRRVRDYAQVKADGVINKDITTKALELLGVDEYGLDEMDKLLLKTLVEKFNGGPVGIKTLAISLGEEEDTLQEVCEAYLIQQGLIKRTAQGREATPLCYECLGIVKAKSKKQNKLWGEK
ncbi:Holliday junction branch migration DNA helicase RuvB [bacterium]|nr:Holliday junction branch migration DNA helicase RuvB [bacterium]